MSKHDAFFPLASQEELEPMTARKWIGYHVAAIGGVAAGIGFGAALLALPAKADGIGTPWDRPEVEQPKRHMTCDQIKRHYPRGDWPNRCEDDNEPQRSEPDPEPEVREPETPYDC